MSFECMAWAIKQRTGGVAAKAVLLHLANCTNAQTSVCRPRIKVIAYECEMSESTVKQALRRLEEIGLVLTMPRFHEGIQLSNDYLLRMTNPYKSEEGGGSESNPGGLKSDPGGSDYDPGVGQNLTPVETGRIETGKETRRISFSADLLRAAEPQSAGTYTAVTEPALTSPEAGSSEERIAPRRARRSPPPSSAAPPPTQEELSAYMKETWPWIPALEYEKCHAHHQSRGWVDPKGKPWKDWKAVAKTWATNWKSFNQDKYMEIQRFEQSKARSEQQRAQPDSF